MSEETKVTQPASGMAEAINPKYGCRVLWIHYSADPEKDLAWAFRLATNYGPLRMQSPDWLQEYEMDLNAHKARRTYWAFEPDRNVVEPYPINPDDDIILAFDFGQTDPTAVLFIAQSKQTKQMVVFDEIYKSNTPIPIMRGQIYERLAMHIDCDVETLDINATVADCVGDPQGKAYMIEYGQIPFPIYIRGHSDGSVINRIPAGEAKVNQALAPSFVCSCPASKLRRQWTQQLSTTGMCVYCEKPCEGIPMLVLMDGRAPNLKEQLQKLMRALPNDPELEVGERNKKTPDHAADALRYGVYTRDFDVDSGSDLPAVLRMRPELMTIAQKMEAERVRAALRGRPDVDQDEIDWQLGEIIDPMMYGEEEGDFGVIYGE